jgi:ribosomal protein S18 acetylase RimI-like enzyme
MAHVDYRWRAEVSDAEVNGLTRSYGGQAEDGWWDRIRPHSLGWATAHLAGDVPVGFANVAWDGGDHAFLLDPKVRPDLRHRGVATGLVRLAATSAGRAGCEWLHVDFRDELAPFYFDACGFEPTAAGLLRLR